jgi:tetratricopeptide (TPR) repeat protein
METNLFLLDKSWIGESLFRWISEELQMEELGEQLRRLYATKKDVYDCVSLIFQESGYYSKAELAQLDGMLVSMRGKTPMECRKMRGDHLLAAKKYRQAAYCYLELLRPEFQSRMTEELQGDVMHNLGVAYARLFLFEEAAQMFAGAYKKRKSADSRDAYLYALNYVPDTYPEEYELDINYGVMRDALKKFNEISVQEDYYRERQEVLNATSAFDWKKQQAQLLKRWKQEYETMVQ